MSESPSRVSYSRSRRGSLNRSSTAVRLALHKMNFDGVVEWVKAFRQLEGLYAEADTDKKLAILKEKFSSLETLFAHVFPKIKEAELMVHDLIEIDAEIAEQAKPEDQSTDKLLQAVKSE